MQILSSRYPRKGSVLPHCGEKVNAKRITIKRLVVNFLNALTNFDLPFIKTTRQLLLSPYKVIVPYLEGTRKTVNSPSRYTLFIIGMYGIFQILSSNFLTPTLRDNIFTFYKIILKRARIDNLDQMSSIIEIIQTGNHVFYYLMVPVLGALSFFFFHAKQYNYAERMVIAIYPISLSVLLIIILGLGMSLLAIDQLSIYFNTIGYVVTFIILIRNYTKVLKVRYFKSFLLVFITAIIFILTVFIVPVLVLKIFFI